MLVALKSVDVVSLEVDGGDISEISLRDSVRVDVGAVI